jgi:hypothetical protein
MEVAGQPFCIADPLSVGNNHIPETRHRYLPPPRPEKGGALPLWSAGPESWFGLSTRTDWRILRYFVTIIKNPYLTLLEPTSQMFVFGQNHQLPLPVDG